MEDIGTLKQWTFNLGDLSIVLNAETLIMSWIVMGVLIIFAIHARRSIKLIPTSWTQHISESILSFLNNLVVDSIGETGKKFFPVIATLFFFFLLCDWIGTIPFGSEPTKDLNTTLSMGILGFLIAHGAGIKVKGLKGYLKQYVEPMFFMAPINLVGELAKVVSISFRLYGNMMGGAIIIIVISHLIYSLLLPPFLYFFFGFFIGTIQAFVFTTLTLIYISLQVK
jgi:F-type H+-transporting ATPase subunit a